MFEWWIERLRCLMRGNGTACGDFVGGGGVDAGL